LKKEILRRSTLSITSRNAHLTRLSIVILVGAVLLFPVSDVSDVHAASLTVEIGLNFTASTFGAENPVPWPDITGAVGPNHIVQLTNARYSVFRKSDGALVQTSLLQQFWRDAGLDVCPADFCAFDPRVLYDAFSQRWFASSANAFTTNAKHRKLLLAVSKSSDPTGGWSGFLVDTDPTDQGRPDFPVLGIDRDGIYIPMLMVSSLDLGKAIVVIPKADLLAAVPTIANASLFSIPPPTDSFLMPIGNLDDLGLPFQLFSHETASASFNFFAITGAVRSPILNTTAGSVSLSSYPRPPDAAQPAAPTQKPPIACGTTFGSSTFRRNGVIWEVEGVGNGGRAALRWFKINAVTHVLLQEGLVDDAQLSFYCASIAANEFGDVVIGFSGSSTTQFVSSYAVVGETDASGVTTFGKPLLLKAGADDFDNASGRWGDFSATVVDPSNPLHFWTFQEWVSADDTWSTQITELIVARREIDVAIDIKPGIPPNSINPVAKGVIPVAILTTATFDATTVDPISVRFGATGTEGIPVHAALEDVDRDGDTDMILQFDSRTTGIRCGDTLAWLTGETRAGQAVRGSDSINTVGCRK